MNTKLLPVPADKIRQIAETVPTPFYLYDERGIRRAARALIDAFAWAPGFHEFFAVKATPNPHIMSLLADEGCGMDASSLAELVLCERIGITGERVMFSSNDTPAEEFAHARRMGAIVNLDDVAHLAFLERHAGLPELVCFRYNPGPERRGNAIIGAPEQACASTPAPRGVVPPPPAKLTAVFCDGPRPVADVTGTANGATPEDTDRLVTATVDRLFPGRDGGSSGYGFPGVSLGVGLGTGGRWGLGGGLHF